MNHKKEGVQKNNRIKRMRGGGRRRRERQP